MKFSENKTFKPIQTADLVKKMEEPKRKGNLETRRYLLAANVASTPEELKEGLAKQGQNLLVVDCKECASLQDLRAATAAAIDWASATDEEGRESVLFFANAEAYMPENDEDTAAIHCLRQLVQGEETPVIVHVNPDAEYNEWFWNEMRSSNSGLCGAFRI